jgi:ATP-dependent DNA helicase RecG
VRPSLLDPVFSPIDTLAGVGPKLKPLYERLVGVREGGARVIDLLFHLPSTVLDRRFRPKLSEAPTDTIVTVEVRVVAHRPPPPGRSRAPYRVLTEDETGDLTLVFFNATRQRLEKILPVGEKVVVSGRIELWDGMRQMTHPDHVAPADKASETIPTVEPVYPLTEGLSGRMLRRAVAVALERAPELPEWQDGTFRAHMGFPDWREALDRLHLPKTPEDAAAEGFARRRLAYDELLATQLSLALMRAHMRRVGGRASTGDGRLVRAILEALPFSPTASQTRALAEIKADLAMPRRMLRLLQGDVGSGKTLVALLAMACVVEAGRQATLMAPTEILARQHHARIAPLAAEAGIRTAVLTGRDGGAERTETLRRLAAGEIDILVGTHAVFQEDVAFDDLALAVVDEQHRFGVHQRLALQRKGAAVDMLVMTATPIPRTLLIASFGDMDVSVLSEKPAGRTPVDTRTIPLDRVDDVVDAVRRAVDMGARVYWVCPLVEESETLDVAAASERFEHLRARFGDKVGLLHGRMRPRDKDDAMLSFATGKTSILVATTVIEVGVDVPEATVMVIEHAERFGLAQLHQLRGRIGRGTDRSTCLLLYKGPLSETAHARLAIMRDTEDGFRIAEEDLKLRGPGEVLGTRQSGMPGFRIARAETDTDLLEAARADAKLILATDPALNGTRGDALRILLYLFERDQAISLVRAG